MNILGIWRRDYISLREINTTSDARYSVNFHLCSWCSKLQAQVMVKECTGNVSTNLFYAVPGLLIKKTCIC